MAVLFLNEAVITGLQRLLALRLVGSPPADAIELTASVWIDAMARYPIAWNEQLDGWRINAGFDQLVWQSERWPTVKHLLDSQRWHPQEYGSSNHQSKHGHQTTWSHW